MKNKSTFLKTPVSLIITLLLFFSTQAQNLVAYYEFNGNYNSSGGSYTDTLTEAERLTKTTYQALQNTSPFSFSNNNNPVSSTSLVVNLYDYDNNTETTPLNRAFLVGSNNIGESVTGGNSRTFTAWFKIPDNAGNEEHAILNIGTKAPGKRFTILVLDDNTINSGFDGYGIESITPVNDDTWTFIAVSYNADTNTIAQYITEGSDIVNSDNSEVVGNGITVNTDNTPLFVGTTTSNFSKSFVGELADVRLYSGALTLSEINSVKDGGNTLNTPDISFLDDELKIYKTNDSNNVIIETTLPNRPHTTVYASNGKIVKKEFSKTINIQDLSSGLYIANIRIGNKVKSFKFIK